MKSNKDDVESGTLYNTLNAATFRNLHIEVNFYIMFIISINQFFLTWTSAAIKVLFLKFSETYFSYIWLEVSLRKLQLSY